MPILPIIDTLILLSWTSLTVGGVLKVCNLIFGVNWTVAGMAPTDLLIISLTLLVFSLALIGRTWVKLHDPGVIADQRASSTLDAYAKMQREMGVERVESEDPRSSAQVQSG